MCVNCWKEWRDHLVHNFENENSVSERWTFQFRPTKPVSDRGQAETSASWFPDRHPCLWSTSSPKHIDTNRPSNPNWWTNIKNSGAVNWIECKYYINHCLKFPKRHSFNKRTSSLFLLPYQYTHPRPPVLSPTQSVIDVYLHLPISL